MISVLVFWTAYAALLVAALTGFPIAGIFAYLFALYVDPTEKWWGTYIPEEAQLSLVASIITLFSAFFYKKRSNKFSIWNNKIFLCLFVFVLWMFLQQLWVINLDLHKEGIQLFAKYLLLFFIFYRIAFSAKSTQAIMLACIAGTFYVCYQAWAAKTHGRVEGFGGAGFRDSNTLAMYAASVLTFLAFIITTASNYSRLLLAAAALFILNGIILTGSRGAILALVFTLPVAWFFKPQAIKKWFYIGVIIGFMGFLYLANDIILDRFKSLTIDSSQESSAVANRDMQKASSSAEKRLEIVIHQWRMATDFPWGAGYRATAVLSSTYLPSYLLTGDVGVRSSHNTLMEVLVSFGFIGLFLYLLILVFTTAALLELRRCAIRDEESSLAIVTSALACGLAVWFFAGLFSNFFKAEIMIWLTAATAGLYDNRLREGNLPEN